MSEPLWCEVRGHYCRCHDTGKRCDDFVAGPEEEEEDDDWVNPGGTSEDWE
jgi:hypothetical protein